MKISPAQQKVLKALEGERSFIKCERGRLILIEVSPGRFGYAVRRKLCLATFEALKARGLIKAQSRPVLGIMGRQGTQTVWVKAQ